MFSGETLTGAPERLPRWVLGKPAPIGAGDTLKSGLRQAGLTTVCEDARCPNLADCFSRGVATFMVLGATCTRTCAFCAVEQGTPEALDGDEPERLAEQVARMELSHVVITSVDRDDLPDGGAAHFARCVRAVRERLPGTTVEVLTPDFGGGTPDALTVAAAGPTVFNHNVETVPRLYRQVRPGADYAGSLALLRAVKEAHPGMVTKSGVMVGLGETDEELLAVFADLKAVGCDVLTVGQYLRPTTAQRPVDRYVTPDGFGRLRQSARNMGFAHVAAGPRVRSSYGAAAVLSGLAAGE
ncbi:MAG: lipoyl synthase [Leptospirillia bacterium]